MVWPTSMIHQRALGGRHRPERGGSLVLYFQSYAPGGTTPPAKFVKRSRAGVQRFSGLEYRGFWVEVWRRPVGLAVQRALYSASVSRPEGERVAYLTDFGTAERARLAAQTWIDRQLHNQSSWGPWRPQKGVRSHFCRKKGSGVISAITLWVVKRGQGRNDS
ncbi:MAG: hypothetical protein A2W31_10185 [Planctomycetes bacterium RBG_16_64_10]|nr:MAG: hypothetical protein A2W31_10185 [Planctomycetes bacterium RBG_16_64_10]